MRDFYENVLRWIRRRWHPRSVSIASDTPRWHQGRGIDYMIELVADDPTVIG